MALTQESNPPQARLAILGAGAVGCYFGVRFTQFGGSVVLIGRPAFAAAAARDGIRFESGGSATSVKVEATADPAAVAGADYVLVCTKTTDGPEAVRFCAPHLKPDGALLLLQNGVDNAQRIEATLGELDIDRDVFPAVVYVAAEQLGPAAIRHTARGDLVVGDGRAPGPRTALRRAKLDRFVDLCARAGVPCRLSEDMTTDLWSKMVMNCAFNAVSGLGEATYGEILECPPAFELMHAAIREAIAVARAEGARLDEQERLEYARRLAVSMRTVSSSMAHDMQRRRRTEIASLNGYISRRAKEFRIATPANDALTALVMLRSRES
ncbi:MAG: 2-dehydropantoate 2-reductase [Planctomycetes bacterium]|nr:2-dehydropantoate 2-reductase [Planctomycetota bacterium]